ncbi:hypothetical protein ASPCAL07484 [Aspergillus calidoustus]|uniref:Box C/D snoRNA protein 1 n=1 Tax=Aspergillus calidoustus TaxID=454130 RepID=A0A0U5G3U4_ASPCI|nr:hypothetical protein ASPCAL07484 [Aspergillus calidoustus]
MSEEETLLTNLCAICHLQTPKYRCPRCSTRTCSLPCTRRHKLWSQCSGIRDPAAYLRRSELATESAFDRDFNFITGIERRIERAEREAEDRGVDVSGKRVRDAEVVGLEHEVEEVSRDRGGNGNGNGSKRKRGPESGLSRGEAGFVRRARESGVRVIKAPAGMSRERVNGSKWHHKQKCLLWTVEWITDEGTKRFNSVETCSVAEAYDRVFPLSKEERKVHSENQSATQDEDSEDPTQKPESSTSEIDPQSTSEPSETQPTAHDITTNASEDKPTPHRNIYLYLHRPRTATKQQVLVPLSPRTTLADALRGRTVLEFPTIYVLRSPLDETRSQEQNDKFMLEKEYLRTHPDTEEVDDGPEETDAQPVFGAVDIPNVDESKVLEVLRKDLLGAAPVDGSEDL